MIKHRGLGVAVVLLSSFAAWIYCIATVVLGLIYQAYPGQENVANVAILISTLPTIVMMLAAFASSVILRVCNRKLVVVVSMAISIVAGALILLVEMPLIGVIICSSLLGIPGGTIASANPTVLAIVAPLNLRDKVLGWHNSLMMLGMATFQLLGGIFGETGRFQDGYKTVLILIPILVLVILFYPNVDKDRSLAQAAGGAQETETVPARDGKFPMVAVGMLLLYLFGAIFWNAWFMNYSDYIVNEAQLGTTAMGRHRLPVQCGGHGLRPGGGVLDQSHQAIQHDIGLHPVRRGHAAAAADAERRRVLCGRHPVPVLQSDCRLRPDHLPGAGHHREKRHHGHVTSGGH